MENNNLDELKEYRDKLGKLSEDEKIERDLYLKQLANGEIQGPPTGYASVDKPWLQYHSDEAIMAKMPKMTAYEYMKANNSDNLDGKALNFFGLKTSYSDLFKKIDETAKSLVSMGVKAGDTVIINSVTLPQTVYLLYALNKIGAIANLTDLRSDSNTMQHYINEGNSKIVFTLDSCYNNVKAASKETNVEKIVLLNPKDTVPFVGKVVSDMKEQHAMTKEEKARNQEEKKMISDVLSNDKMVIDWKQFIKNGRTCSDVIDKSYEPNRPLAIVHTSGTTSMPKSVVLTDDNFNAMTLQYGVSDFKYSKGESLLNIIPIFVAYGVVNSLHMPLCLGMTNIVYPKVVGGDFPDIIMDFKPNHVIAIPMHWKFLLNNPKMDSKNLDFLRTAACGGDNLNVELEKQLNDFLEKHNSKNKIVKGYGMTEVSACAVTNTNRTSVVGSVGIPLVKNNIAIVDPDTGKELRTGQKGEICIESPALMKEYLNNESETNNVIKNEYNQRRIHSGDLGSLTSDGRLSIDGRIKRLIIRRGFKISATAIENVIMSNDKIEMCAVVKAPHSEDGEIPFAYIVIKKEFLNEKEEILNDIMDRCIKTLPEYYVPNKYQFLDAMPYTKNSKLDIPALENLALQQINNETLENKSISR